MDYGFAPGGTGYDYFGRRLLGRIPNTKVISQHSILTVESFITHLTNTANNGEIDGEPVGDLLIVSHGNSAGWMAIDLDNSSLDPKGKPARTTTYEVLEQAVASNSVQILPELHGTDSPIPFDVHIRGCRIGQSPKFVEKLKEAFGSPRSVIAPKHFHFAGGIGRKRKRRRLKNITMYGSYEHLNYSFVLFRKPRLFSSPSTAFKTKKEAVDAFHSHGFEFIDESAPDGRSPIPKSKWKKWIPRNVKKRRTTKPRYKVKLGQNIGRGLEILRIEHQFRHRIGRFSWTVTGLMQDPGKGAAKKAAKNALREVELRGSIKANADFQSTHDFAMYKRAGYTNVDDFLDGYAWRCNWRKKDKELFCIGRRHEYTVVVPIVDPPTQHLIFNLFPAVDSHGNITANSGLIRVNKLLHTNSDLFLTV